jgi:hypothetical protein
MIFSLNLFTYHSILHMKKKVLWLLLAAIFIYIAALVFNYSNLTKEISNPEYQKYVSLYRDMMRGKILETINENEAKDAYNLHYRSGNNNGTTGNFEGPQVHLKGIKFHDEYLTGANTGSRLKHFDGVSAHFDPDHTYYGLPDVKISIGDVRLYEIEKGPLAKFLNFGHDNSPKPYRTYRKVISGDSAGTGNKFFLMQLWLTEFHVTVDIRPDRDIPVRITEEEKHRTQYPGYWYGSGRRFIKLAELDKEHKDFRYGDLSFILEIIPDNSPIYVETPEGKTTKADFAIGSIYCSNAIFGNEPSVQRISANVHSGMPLFLNNSTDFGKMNENTSGLSPNLEATAAKLMDLKTEVTDFIWNKPYYVKLFFNNLGTWRSGFFNQNEFHDQVSYTFLMPVFVVGSWDVIVPQEIVPEWDPPKAYVKKISWLNFLPFWNFGIPGKVGTVLLILFIIVAFGLKLLKTIKLI